MTAIRFSTTLWFAALLGLTSACVSADDAPAKTAPVPSLAKANLETAKATAKQWQADAILIQVAGSNVGADGKHVMWDYGFYSPTAKKCAVVNVAPKAAGSTESGDESCASAELVDFMDSDKASTVARSNGITAAHATMVASVTGSKAVWSVMDESGMKPGNVMLDIDAMSGAVLSKTSQ